MDRRKIEIGANVVIGLACLALGLTIGDSNYKLLFFLMAAVFILAIFRPRQV